MYITLLIRILNKSRIDTSLSRAVKGRNEAGGGSGAFSPASQPLGFLPFNLPTSSKYLGSRTWPQFTRMNH